MLSDDQIRDLIEEGVVVVENAANLEDQIGPAGIDLTVGSDYVNPPAMADVIDAHNNPDQELVFEPNTFYNVHTVERIELPDMIRGVINGRLSVESRGLEIVTDGAVDPGYAGQLRLGIRNHLDEEIRLKPGDAIIELGLEQMDRIADTPYGQRESSQYQDQDGF